MQTMVPNYASCDKCQYFCQTSTVKAKIKWLGQVSHWDIEIVSQILTIWGERTSVASTRQPSNDFTFISVTKKYRVGVVQG